MEKISFALLAGLNLRGVKEVLYRLLKRFVLDVDSPMFGGVYDFGEGQFAIKLYVSEDKQFSKWLSIPESMKAQTSFVLELQEATRDASGDYEGKAWEIKAGEHQIKVVA